MSQATWVVWMGVVLAACEGDNGERVGPDGDVDSDVDGDVGSDVDADTDGDTDADTDVDTDSNTASDTGSVPDPFEDCEPVTLTSVESGSGWEGNEGEDISVVARSAAELEEAWTFAFRDPPAQPTVDWESEMVLVYASYVNCPMCAELIATRVWSCHAANHLVLEYAEDDCDFLWYVGSISVVPRDDREVIMERSQLPGVCSDYH